MRAIKHKSLDNVAFGIFLSLALVSVIAFLGIVFGCCWSYKFYGPFSSGYIHAIISMVIFLIFTIYVRLKLKQDKLRWWLCLLYAIDAIWSTWSLGDFGMDAESMFRLAFNVGIQSCEDDDIFWAMIAGPVLWCFTGFCAVFYGLFSIPAVKSFLQSKWWKWLTTFRKS
jgi:hypothetical protein